MHIVKSSIICLSRDTLKGAQKLFCEVDVEYENLLYIMVRKDACYGAAVGCYNYE